MKSDSRKTPSEAGCNVRTSRLSSAPTVSIVTPVYNGEQYIRECIESVIEQTYTNWEYLIVDNCSTDATRAIADEYAQQDQRITVVKNSEFLDIMPNWNRALRLISPDSTFCKVVHADDTLFPSCVESMVSVAQKDDRIGIVGAYRKHGDWVDLNWLPSPDEVFSGREVCRLYLMGNPDIFGSPSNILMRSDIVRSRERFYDENNIHADTAACFEILKEYDFGYVHQVLTYTRRHNESVTSRVMVLNTQQAAKYCRTVIFGREFLSPDEYRMRVQEVKKKYYNVLASRYIWKIVMKNERDTRKEFFAYHKRVFEELGEKPERLRLLISAIRMTYNKVLSLLRVRRVRFGGCSAG